MSASRQWPLDQVVVDQDQLDVGRLGGRAEARRSPVAADLGVVAEPLEEADELAAAVGVAVDDDGAGTGPAATNRASIGTTRLEPGNGCRGSSPTRARAAANWTRRLGARRAPRPAGRGGVPSPRALRSVTWPRASTAATAARSSCRRRSPSRTTSPSTSGPAASAAANVPAGSLAGNAADPTRSIACSSARLRGDLRQRSAGSSSERRASQAEGASARGVTCAGPGPSRRRPRSRGRPGSSGTFGRRASDRRAGRVGQDADRATRAALRTAGRSAARSPGGRRRGPAGLAPARPTARQVRARPAGRRSRRGPRPRRRRRPGRGCRAPRSGAGRPRRRAGRCPSTIAARSSGDEARAPQRLDQRGTAYGPASRSRSTA